MTNDYTIDASFVGQTIGPTNGAIVSLRMSAPPVYETPSFDAGAQSWVSGCFTLRGTGDCHDAVSISPQSNGGAFNQPGAVMIHGGSVAYSGALVVVAVPKNSVWSLTLSDAPSPQRLAHELLGG